MKDKNKHLYIGAIGNEEESGFIPMLADENDNYQLTLNEESPLPILTLRNIVLFPGVVMPVSVGRKKSLRLLREIYKKHGIIGAVAQKDKNVEEPGKDDIFSVGTIAQIVRILEMPDNSTTVILQGRAVFNIRIITDNPYIKAKSIYLLKIKRC